MQVCVRLARILACGLVFLLLCVINSAWAEDTEALETLKTTSWWTEVQNNLNEQEYEITSVPPLLASPSWTAEGNQSTALFGFSVSSAGDVNGDSYDDIIVTAPYYSNGEYREGRAFVFHGSALGLATTPDWTAEGNEVNFWYCLSTSSAGDVNGDSYDDIIVGTASNYYRDGRAYVFYGSSTGLSATPDWTVDRRGELDLFGWSVSGAGDVNGDTYDDIIVGAQSFDNGETDEGRVYVYHGSPTGLDTVPDWIAESDWANARFGHSVSGAGDVNGDTYDDVIVGAQIYSNGEVLEGRAYVFYGSPTGLDTVPAWTVESNQDSAYYGMVVAGAGDVNGDSFDDIIVGAVNYDNGEHDEGMAFVYHGSASGLPTVPDWTAESDQIDAWLGFNLSGAGDLNGDSFDDVVVGALNYDNGEIDEGRAFVYLGSASGLSTTPDWMDEGDQVEAHFGHRVSGAGNVNGDCYDDLIVGAYTYDNGETDEGIAFVYYGRGPCGVLPSSLDFSTLALDHSKDDTFIITNDTGDTLSGTVSESCDHFSIVSGGGPFSLAEGETLVVTVRFQPTENGVFNCTIEIGNDLCCGVFCTGIGDDTIPVMVQAFQSHWADNYVEISWSLVDASIDLSFDVFRRLNEGGDYTLIQNPDIFQRGEEFVFEDRATEPGNTYRYRVAIIEDSRLVTAFETSVTTPSWKFDLKQNHPNPFNPTTEIGFSLVREGRVSLIIYDIAGRLIRTLVDHRMTPGTYIQEWDGRNSQGNSVSSGVYLYRLTAGNRTLTKKMLLLK